MRTLQCWTAIGLVMGFMPTSAQAQAQASALVEQLERQGLPPEQIQQQLLMLLSKTVPQNMGPGGQPGAMQQQGAIQ